jgi:hypothetical protein
MELLNDKARDVLTVSATQVGKTFALSCWLIREMWTYRGPNPFWWCAPVYPQVEAGYRLVLHMATSAGVVKSKTVSPFPRINLVNGTTVEFRSWEREQNLMGTSIAGGVIDEAGLLSQEAQAAISTRRSSTLGPLRYIGNPGVMAGPFRRLCSLAEAPDHDPAIFSMHKWTWQDKAAALPTQDRIEYEAFIGQERLSLPEYEFRRLYDAEWTEDEAAVFRGVDKVILHGDNRLLQPHEDEFVLGVDVAQVSDYMAVVSFGLRTHRIELRDRYRGIGYPQAAVRLKEIQDQLNGAMLTVEANGPGVALIQELERVGASYCPFTTTNQSKQEIVMAMAGDISQGRVSIADIEPMPYELASFRYERLPSGLYRYQAPGGEHDDTVMAACLARWASIYASGPAFEVL